MTTNDETTQPIDAEVIEGEVVADTRARVPVPTAAELAESPGETTTTVEQVLISVDGSSAILMTSEFLDVDADAPHIVATADIRAKAVATAGDLRRRGHVGTAREVMLASLEQQAEFCGIETALTI